MEGQTEKCNDVEKMEPGASRHGNFNNYYKFHPADERVQQLPRGIWRSSHADKKYLALDVGCNAGNLTLAMHRFLTTEQLQNEKVSILGIDLDPILIKRAKESNLQNEGIQFQELDFFSKNREELLQTYLAAHERCRFDVIFAFSITMWIHLNHGDSGLEGFLKAICKMADMVVIEPQIWKCYRNASRRLRRANQGDFPLLESLEYKGNVEEHIAKILQNLCGFEKVSVSEVNEWRRKLLIYKRIS